MLLRWTIPFPDRPTKKATDSPIAEPAAAAKITPHTLKGLSESDNYRIVWNRDQYGGVGNRCHRKGANVAKVA